MRAKRGENVRAWHLNAISNKEVCLIVRLTLRASRTFRLIKILGGKITRKRWSRKRIILDENNKLN